MAFRRFKKSLYSRGFHRSKFSGRNKRGGWGTYYYPNKSRYVPW